jgi:hypothetical protein
MTLGTWTGSNIGGYSIHLIASFFTYVTFPVPPFKEVSDEAAFRYEVARMPGLRQPFNPPFAHEDFCRTYCMSIIICAALQVRRLRYTIFQVPNAFSAKVRPLKELQKANRLGLNEADASKIGRGTRKDR